MLNLHLTAIETPTKSASSIFNELVSVSIAKNLFFL